MEGGRCEVCEGEGTVTIEMQFMADIQLVCENCKGKRFKQEILEVEYRGKIVADVLDMTVDEPTTGLHFHDISKLLQSFDALIDQGHSILVIEHNPEVIKCADWLIDIGPEGGQAGGNIVFEGIPEDLVKSAESYTGKYLKSKFRKRSAVSSS